MPQKPLPYVTAALLCEKVIQEKDGVITLVRIIDRLQYRIEGLPADAKPVIGVQGFIAIKAGDVSGEHTLKVVSQKPNGERKDVHIQPLELRGNDHGMNLILNIGLGVEQDGIYWFDVFFDDILLSKTPITVTALPEQPPIEAKG